MRSQLDPPLLNAFKTAFKLISAQPSARTPKLATTGSKVVFVAETKHARDGRPFIALPHNNRIYGYDWEFATNSMGKEDKGGQQGGSVTILDRLMSGPRRHLPLTRG
jgi:hypothetical protein